MHATQRLHYILTLLCTGIVKRGDGPILCVRIVVLSFNIDFFFKCNYVSFSTSQSFLFVTPNT